MTRPDPIENARRVHAGNGRLPTLSRRPVRGLSRDRREDFALALLAFACGVLAWQFGKTWAR